MSAQDEERGRAELARILGGTISKELDHLPIVADVLRRLRVAETVDARVPRDYRNRVTTGECVEALIVSILMGSHTLYRLVSRLRALDCALVFPWGERIEHFSDRRLAKALDALFACGLQELYADFLANAIRAFELSVNRLHTDTTSVKVHGAYAGSVEPLDPEVIDAVPHLTYGHSKDHRPDLKQILIGLTVTGDGGVPLHGRVASGNRADALEFRHALRQIARVVPDPQRSVVVMDSKGFAGETQLLFREHGVGYVTLLPRSVGIWAELEERFERADQEGSSSRSLLKIKLEDHDEDEGEALEPVELARWEGRSFAVDYLYQGGAEASVIPLRALVVESTAQREKKQATLEREREREGRKVERAAARLSKRAFACEADAQAAARELARASYVFHRASCEVVREERLKKRKRAGRPRKDEVRETETLWRARVTLSAMEEAAFERELRRRCRFVIVGCREHELTAEIEDAELFDLYHDQDKVEKAMQWLKGPLRVAPIFLELPERIAGLGVLYVLALQVNALIQREIRRRLQALETDMPGNKGWTQRPTTQVLFRLFEGIRTLHDPESNLTVILGTNTEQLRVLEILGIRLEDLGGGLREVIVAKPHVPQRGERAARPVPRKERGPRPKKHGSGPAGSS